MSWSRPSRAAAPSSTNYRAKPELAVPEPAVVLSARQRQLLAELLDDALNDPDAPSYTAAERRELAAVLAALGGA